MPIYTYHCAIHGEQEHVMKFEERDKAVCRTCSELLIRAPAERPGLLKLEGDYQMGVYMGNEATGVQTPTVKGHFGKEAAKRRASGSRTVKSWK